MSDLLDGIKFSVMSSDDAVNYVSLKQLLIDDGVLQQDQRKRTASTSTNTQESSSGNVVKGRKAARRSRSRKNRPQDFASPNSAQAARDIRTAQIRRIQERNNEMLQEVLAQELSSESAASELRADVDGRPTDYEGSNDPADLAPVILGLIDFKRVFGDVGQPTGEHSSIEYKRDVRRLNVDLLSLQDSSEITDRYEMERSQLALALRQHMLAKKDFMDSLSVELNLDDLELITGALNLRIVSGVTNTKLLSTICRDYANSFSFASHAALELSRRTANAGTQLPPRFGSVQEDPSQVKLIKAMRASYDGNNLTLNRDPFKRIRENLPQDLELALSTLSLALGKETLFSANIAKHSETFYGRESRGALTGLAPNRDDTSPYSMLGTDGVERHAFDAARAGAGSDRAFFLGASFSKVERRKGADRFDPGPLNLVGNFPFEARKDGNPDRERRKKTASSFITDSYEDFGKTKSLSYVEVNPGPVGFDTPYAAALSSATNASERLLKMIGTVNPVLQDVADQLDPTFLFDESGDSSNSLHKPFLKALDITSRAVVESFVTPPFKAPLMESIVVAQLRDLNATDMCTFMVYLAFLHERIEGYNGVGAPPEGPSRLVRKSHYIQTRFLRSSLVEDTFMGNRVDRFTDLSGKSATRKISNVFTPTPLKVSPGLDGQENFMAPQEETTITATLEAAGADAGTLQSITGFTFNEIADFTARMIFDKLLSKASPATPGTGSSVSSRVPDVPEGFPSTPLPADDDGFVQAIETMKGLFRRTEMPPAEEQTSPILELLNFREHINDSEAAAVTSIFSSSGTTINSGFDRENIFAGWCYLMSCMSEMILDPIIHFQTVLRFGGGVTLDIPDVGPGLSNMVADDTRISIQKKIGEQISGNKLNALRSNNLDPSNVSGDLPRAYPGIENVKQLLNNEKRFLTTTPVSLTKYFSNVLEKYSKMKDTLSADVDGVPLGVIFQEGLVPSVDSAKLLQHYPSFLNSTAFRYGGVKVNDPALSDGGYQQMMLMFREKASNPWADSDKSKIMAVGLPTGLLQESESNPVPFDSISDSSSTDAPTFDIVIQKIDESRPYALYDTISFPFSRDLFFKEVDSTKADSYVYTYVTDELVDTEVGLEEISRQISANAINDVQLNLGERILQNHYNDYFLKIYLSLQHDLDFYESSFPRSKDLLKSMVNPSIQIPSLEFIDTLRLDFLSGSNLAFTKDTQDIKAFPFYNPSSFSLDMRKKPTTDPYEYAGFDYASTYGTIFNKEQERRRLGLGTVFEKILCVPFDDSDFGSPRLDPAQIEALSPESRLALEESLQRSDPLNDATYDPSRNASLITYRAQILLRDASAFDLSIRGTER